MAEYFVRPFRFIQSEVKQGLAVIGPFHTGMVVHTAKRIHNEIRVQSAGYQVLDTNRVNLTAFDIQGIGKLSPIRADRECADAAKRFSLGKLILIEQNL